MTTQRLSFDPKPRRGMERRRAFFSAAFFRGELRRDWPKTLCYALILFLVLPLPLLFQLNSRSSWQGEQLMYSLNHHLVGGTFFYTLCAAAIAVFAGMLATRYLNKRAAVDYYHSLPIRREGLLVTRYLGGIVHFTFALLSNVLLCLVLLLSVSDVAGTNLLPYGNLLAAAGYMLLVFLFFYSLSVFCGTLCGTSNMQVILTGLCLFAWPLFRVLSLAYLDTATAKVDISYYLDRGWEYTSPAIRLILLVNTAYRTVSPKYSISYLVQGFSLWEIAVWLVAALLLLLGALAVYRIRHVERAGTPVVFTPVATAVKWTVTVLSTMSLGWLFGQIGGGALWMFFGFLMGGFLSFLLMNTILTKNPKQMFDGWRVMLIYLLTFCLLTVGAYFAVGALEDHLPKGADQLTLRINGEDYGVEVYTDPAVIEAWVALMELEPGEAEDVYAAAEKLALPYDSYTFETQLVTLRATAKLGPLTVPYRQRSFSRASARELLAAVANSQEFEAGWDAIMAALPHTATSAVDNNGYVPGLNFEPSGLLEMIDPTGSFGELYPSDLGEDIGTRLVAQMPEDITYDFFQAPGYCDMWVYDFALEGREGRYNFTYQLNTNTPAVIEQVMGMTVDELYAAMAEKLAALGGVRVVKRTAQVEANAVMHVTDRAQLESILRGMGSLETRSYNAACVFTALDESYGIILPTQGTDWISCYFIDGCVPAFVQTALGDA